jgi:hypothetical protein
MFIKIETRLLQQALAMNCIVFEWILQIICRFSKKLEFRDSHLLLTGMDPLTCKALFHKQINRINRSVWETVKSIGSLLKAKDNDSKNDLFYTPSSPLKTIFEELETHMIVDCGKRHSCILLDYHLWIIDQLLYRNGTSQVQSLHHLGMLHFNAPGIYGEK